MMYTKILVPLDGSPVSELVLPYARHFAGTLALPVELLHAIEPDIVALYADPTQSRCLDRIEADLKQRSLDYLKSVERSFPNGSTITSSVQIARPADAIVGGARPGALIAMATHGRSGIKRWLLGSVAEKVLHSTTNHLLLVRATEETKANEAPLKTAIVPLDGSPTAEEVLPYVSDLAKKMDLQVLLLRVYALPIVPWPDEAYFTANLDQILQQVKDEANRYLEQKTTALKAAGLKRVSSSFVEGESADVIIELARKTPDNMIFMCTHGRSGFARILGSVTNRVVRHSGDPVLVVRAVSGT